VWFTWLLYEGKYVYCKYREEVERLDYQIPLTQLKGAGDMEAAK